jgi:large subunit ribosomal protein L22
VATQATDTPVTVRAQARWVRTSARKARVVLEHVRGKRYVQAHAALTFSTRAVSRDILQVLESAAANAEANLELEAQDLVVDACFADEGPTAKRWQPRARGRANRIRKRTCHVTIVLRHDPLPEAADDGKGGRRRGGAAEATIAASRRRRRKAEEPAASEATAMAGTAPLEGEETEAPEAPEADAAVAELEAPDTDAEAPEQAETTEEPAEGSPEAAEEAEEPAAAAEDDTAEEAAEETKKPTEDEEA